MDALKKKRASVKTKITRIQTFLDNTSRTLPSVEAIKVRLEALETAWSEYNGIHEDMLSVANSQELNQEELDYAETEEKYYNIKVGLRESLHPNGPSTQTSEALSTPNTSSLDVRLPKITLPTFSGNLLQWPTFFDLFSSIVHKNNNISDSQKMHYVKSSLTGEAAGLLQALEITNANYAVSWNLLLDRYQNDRQLIYSNLKALFNQPPVNPDSASGLRYLLDNTVKYVRALEALGLNTEHWNPILVFLIAERLDADSRKQWELSSSAKTFPHFNELKEFLEQRCRALEASGCKAKIKTQNSPKEFLNSRTKPSCFAVPSVSKPTKCPMCNGEHLLFGCSKFANTRSKEKFVFVKKNKLCFNCLRQGHTSQQCKSISRCRSCGFNHHTLLHVDKQSQPDQDLSVSDGSAVTITTHLNSATVAEQILLSTALVKITDCLGNKQVCRVLLDSGSQVSLITETCVQRLGLKRSHAKVSILGIAQSGSEITRGAVNLQLSSCTTTFTVCIKAFILPKLTTLLPSVHVDSHHWSHIANLNLADPTFNVPGNIDIILGADVYSDLLLEGKISGGNDLPSAMNTQLGWILSGRLGSSENAHEKHFIVHFVQGSELHEQIKHFWELEETLPERHLKPEETKCEEHFLSTHSRDSTGRYKVALPIKTNHETLGLSRELAVKRLVSLERRLERNPDHRESYNEFMDQYQRLGHMELIPTIERKEVLGHTYYLPHHYILKESSTTKLRVVFDASAKTTSGTSLNDILLVGPKLQDDMWDILMRFRMHKYALTADIEKMYRQINVVPSDANLQRIVWRASPSEPVQDFRLTTVTYGTASAPYQAIRTLQQLALVEGEAFPLARDVTLQDFYVDDLISGASSISSGLELQSQLISMMSRGGFVLRKWASNETRLLDALPEDYRETRLNLNEANSVKALGLHWQPESDEFFVKVALSQNAGPLTKRAVLSDVTKLYDPMGWLSPTIFFAKLLIQKLWISGISWDESLPNTLANEWITLRMQLFDFNQFRLPRWVQRDEDCVHHLHGFCDASQQGYGAVIYLRSERSNGSCSVHILCSKTKVAPIKQVSLPRLELCGAVLLARLFKRVRMVCNICLESCRAWTDSTVVLSWLTGHPSRWKTFVANRVAEIQDLLPPEHWAHVKTCDNPADAASRGLLPRDLLRSTLWWAGPSWLGLRCQEWPQSHPVLNNSTECSNEKKTLSTCTVATVSTWDQITRHSSLIRLKRVVAYCLRFINNARSTPEKRQVGFLTTSELNKALIYCVKNVQAFEFADVIRSIKSGRSISSPINSLNPFLDETGLIRVGGRLHHAHVSYDQRHPILLPKKHHLTELIIINVHCNQLHAGVQATLATIHQSFWIVNGRSVVRQIIHKCLKCFRDRTRVMEQQMGDLPPHRLEPTRPFLRSGVDFGGPLLVKSTKGRGGKLSKVYIALFICLTTKAIHLELVTDLTTDAFIAALHRFMSRRGKCSDIYSDNATNLVGAKSELKELHRRFKSHMYNKTIADELASSGTTWHFIPPNAPHFGGLWEAGIKSTKTHLRRIVGNTILTFEELYTVLTQIEACLNSRPLCPLSNDPNDLSALTPGHFLIGAPLNSVPQPDLTTLNINRLSRWQLVQTLTQHFWKRWQREYLTNCQQRSKWKTKGKNLQTGDLVLIKEENVPPLKWIMGRVVSTHPGKDNIVRVATVKTSKGHYNRPITKLCLLPL